MGKRSLAISQGNIEYVDLKQQFIYWMEYQGWSKRTIESYENNVQRFINYLKTELDWRSLMDIDPQIIHKYQHMIHKSCSSKVLSKFLVRKQKI